MADPFDGLMSAADYGVGLAGRIDAGRENIRGRQLDLFNSLGSALSSADALAAERTESKRRFDLGVLQANREYMSRQEDSAFARLSAALETQLALADNEAKARQQAFENTLRMQSNAVQQRLQSFRLDQLDRQMEMQDFIGEATAAYAKNAAQKYDHPLDFADDLAAISSRYEGGLSALATAPGGKEFLEHFNGLIRASRMAGTGLPRLSSGLIGEEITGDAAEKELAALDLTRADPTADQLQSLALYYDRAERGLTDAERAAIDPGPDALPGDRAFAVLSHVANGKRDSAGWNDVARILESPKAKMLVKEWYDTGALEPIRDRETLEELHVLASDHSMLVAKAMEATGGTFLADPRYEDQRQELEDEFEQRRIDILAGKNPNAAWSRQGAVSFDKIDAAVREDADVRWNMADMALEFTGLAGAGRLVNRMRGKKYDRGIGWDLLDAASIPLMFTGLGAAWKVGKFGVQAVRSGMGVRAVAGAAAQALRAPAMKAAAAKAAAATQWKAALGLADDALAAGAKLRSARLGLSTAEATAAVAGRDVAAARSILDMYKSGRIVGNPAANARVAEFLSSRAATAASAKGAVSGFAAAEKAAVEAAKAAGRAKWAGKVGADLAAKEAASAGRAAVWHGVKVGAGAGGLATMVGRRAADSGEFSSLDYAKTRVAKVLDAVRGGDRSPETITALRDSLDAYMTAAGSYYPGGEIPPELRATILNIKNLVPVSVFRKIQREFKANGAAASGQPYRSVFDLISSRTQVPSAGLVPAAQPMEAASYFSAE